MKIALPTRDNNIDSHFGHCEFFTIFTINNKAITNQEVIASPVGCGCKSDIAHSLSELGVQLMLAGNMGDGAVYVLTRSGIQVIRGCSGDVKDVALSWLNGELTDSGVVCQEHEHSHEHKHDREHGHKHEHELGHKHEGELGHKHGHENGHQHEHEC